jgi:putative ABC transport system permease protein
MRFSTFIFRNVLRRRIRSTLTMTGMALAVAAVVALVGLADGFKYSMLKLYVERDVAFIITKSDSLSPLTVTLPAKVSDAIEKVPGVAAICPGLVDFQTIEECGNDPVGIQGWKLGNFMFDELKIQRGEMISEKDRHTKPVLIGEKVAEVKSLKVGDTLTIAASEEKFNILGIFKSNQEIENGMVIMLLEDAQKALGKTNLITGCTVKVTDKGPEALATVKSAIEGQVAEECGLKGKLKALSPDEFIRQNKQIRMATAMAWMTSVVALVIGGIGVLNTMFMSVFERTREIGILRAIGWRPRRVMRMILMESVLLSIGGGIVGTAAGLGFITLLSRFPVVNGVVQAAITPAIVAEGFAIAVLVGVIGALYPAFRGSCLLPTEALRHE